MKGIAGTGALAVPYAVSQTGIILAIFFYIFFSFGCYYCAYSMIRYHEYLQSPKHFLGLPGYYIVIFAILVTLWGASIGITVVSTDFAFPDVSSSTIRIYCCLIITIIEIILVLFKNTKPLVYISSFGLVALIVSFVILFIRGGIDYGISITAINLFPADFYSLLRGIGVFIYTLGYILFMFPLYKALDTQYRPRASSAVLAALILMTCLYLFIGIILFCIFQAHPLGVQSNILRNLDPTSVDTSIISIAMMVSCLGQYPLTLLSVFEIVETPIHHRKENSLFVTDCGRVSSRILQVILLSVISLLIPFFGSILSFIGSFTSMMVELVLPSLLNIMGYSYFKSKHAHLKLIADSLFFTFFAILMIICTYFSFIDLINTTQ
ncbi:hypothetical protein WA158_006086 [Blastocystis sp. Blastoise]